MPVAEGARMAAAITRSMGRHMAIFCAVAVTAGLTPAFVASALAVARAARGLLGFSGPPT
jgi:hypothetical protein